MLRRPHRQQRSPDRSRDQLLTDRQLLICFNTGAILMMLVFTLAHLRGFRLARGRAELMVSGVETEATVKARSFRPHGGVAGEVGDCFLDYEYVAPDGKPASGTIRVSPAQYKALLPGKTFALFAHPHSPGRVCIPELEDTTFGQVFTGLAAIVLIIAFVAVLINISLLRSARTKGDQ